MDPSDINDVIGQYQPSGGPLKFRFRRDARSTDQANPDTTRDSAELQQDNDVGAEAEPAQEQNKMFIGRPSSKQRARRREKLLATLR